MSTNVNTNDKKEKKQKTAVDKRTTALKLTSVFSVVILLVIVLFFNIIVDGILGKKLEFDLSASGQNTISDASKAYLDSLPDGTNIRIVGLMDEPTNLSGPWEYVVPLVEDYAVKSNGKVTLEYVNPESYPYIISELDPTGIYDIGNSSGSYAICFEGKIKLINPYDDCFLYEEQYNASSGYNVPMPVNNIAESAFTNAMINLTNGYTHKAYIVQDIKQNVTSEQLATMLDTLGVEVGYLDYGDSEFIIPADCEILILSCIETDITEVMASQMDSYLTRGGKMIVSTDYVRTASKGTVYTNLNSMVLNLRGLNLENYMIMETDTNYLLSTSSEKPDFIAQAANDEVATLGGQPMFLAQNTMAVSRVATKYDSSIDVANMIVTSDKAIRYVLDPSAGGFVTEGTNSSYNVAMSSKGKGTNAFELYVFGTSTFTSDEHIAQYGYGSSNVVLTRSLIKNMIQIDTNYEVASRELNNYKVDTSKISMTNSSALIVILVAVIPLALIITGTVVYTKRKNL